jgi:hypothetical protein
MPTGYTCIIDDHEDVTFEQYLWRCARAFGALVMMRDDPTDAPIPERFEASGYHVKELANARAKLAELEILSIEQAETMAAADHEAAVSWWRQRASKEGAIDERYAAIRERVMAWEPPSPDHEELKKFMLEQLRTGRPYSSARDPKPEKKTAREWLDAQIKDARWSVDYHEKNLRAEHARTEERNRWLAELRESVPYVKQPERT